MKPDKIAIMTIVSNAEKYRQIWQRVEPMFNAYADKCGADLLVLQDIPPDLPSPHWAKFSIHELLKKQYARLAFIDADIIIRPDAPNIFDLVPEGEFGIFNEGAFTPRSICIHEAKKVFNVDLPKWNGKDYYNTGVMVLSREHRHIFKINEPVRMLRNAFGEQTYLNMRIMKAEIKVFPLPFKFNRLSIMDRITGMSRLDSYFVHYAGDGYGPTLEKMDRDIAKWEVDGPDFKYRQQIFVWSLGGLGDCVAAEPTIRHMRNVVYPDADIYLMSNNHFLYHHIEGVEFSRQDEFPKKEFDAILEFRTHPTPFDLASDFGYSFGHYCPHGFLHAIDWVSLQVLGQELPMDARTVKLKCDVVTELYSDAVQSAKADCAILVHAGTGWETKTFPAEWWQEVIDSIDREGIKVILIGAQVNDEHGYVPITCPHSGLDLRDKLSVGQLIALCSIAPVLVTNDSAPLHIAGAFDNYIVLIPICKHPDYILPYRHGRLDYKAKAIYRRLLYDDEPMRGQAWQLSHFKEGKKIDDYLPDPQEVIEQAIAFYMQSKNNQLFCMNKKQEEIKHGNSTTVQYRATGNGYGSLEPDRGRLSHAICRSIPDHEARGENAV